MGCLFLQIKMHSLFVVNARFPSPRRPEPDADFSFCLAFLECSRAQCTRAQAGCDAANHVDHGAAAQEGAACARAPQRGETDIRSRRKLLGRERLQRKRFEGLGRIPHSPEQESTKHASQEREGFRSNILAFVAYISSGQRLLTYFPLTLLRYHLIRLHIYRRHCVGYIDD